MYTPSHFQQSEPALLHKLMREQPLASLVISAAAGLHAEHIPFYLQEGEDGRVCLQGHVARANSLWREVGEGCAALAIFHGPACYISPSWYPSKQEHGKVVPTWNYVVVQAQGQLLVRDDPAWVRAQIVALTEQQEGRQGKPWAVTDAPEEYLQRMGQAIVGIELVVSQLSGKWKVSQNQSLENRRGVVAGLSACDDPAAQAMAALIDIG